MRVGDIIKTKKPLRLYCDDEWVTVNWSLIWCEKSSNSKKYTEGRIVEIDDYITVEFETDRGRQRFELSESDIEEQYKRKLKIDKLLNNKL